MKINAKENINKEESDLLSKINELQEKIKYSKISIISNKLPYKKSIEYELNINFPNDDIKIKSIEFILEINITRNTIHLYSLNLIPISDGRDLLPSFFPFSNNNTININTIDLFQLIKGLQNFLSNLSSYKANIGKFYLGGEYDINLINNKLIQVTNIKCCHIDKIDGELIDIPSLVSISDEYLCLYEYGKSANKYISNEDNKFTLVFYASLRSLLSFKKSIVGSIVTLCWGRKNRDSDFLVKIAGDTESDMDKVMDVLINKIKGIGYKMNIFERKSGNLPNINIDKVENNITKLSLKLKNNEESPTVFKKLLSAYEEAIEYYSAINNNKYIEYNQKVQELLKDEKYAKFIS